MWRIPFRQGFTPLQVYEIFDLDREVPKIPRPSESTTWEDVALVVKTTPELTVKVRGKPLSGPTS